MIWMRPERPARGPQPSHSRDEIAAAAVAIADAEGIEAVSMRRVAAAIGAGTMSLYRYVPKKEDLFDLMIDAVGGEYDLPTEPSGDPRADLTGLAHQGRALMRRHRWLPTLLAVRQPLGPNTLRYAEFVLAALAGTDLDGTTKMETIGLLNGLVIGMVQWESAQAEASRRAGVTPAEWAAAQVAYLRHVAGSGKYPRFAAVLAEGGARPDSDALFARALNRFLDGILPAVERSL